MLSGKKIILGVTGSIAAYKSAILVRLLIKEHALVKVIMTPLAKQFITPLTLATLSKNPVLTEFFNAENGDWNNHVELGIWADAMVIAPASANTIAKLANGIADNLLLTTYLSARCPVFIVPAMDMDMLSHPSTQKNIQILKSSGNHILEPSTGELASGLVGKGRMEEPEVIVNYLKDFFKNPSKKKALEKLSGKKIIITAGPTYESIDAVRFIGNYSSGKMGFALADALANEHADITLITGPTELKPGNASIKVVNVRTAKEMYEACIKKFPSADGAILAAAVADYRPKSTAKGKIRHNNQNLILELEPTKDIAAELGKVRTSRQFLAGFALETDNELENATAKLKRKNFDFIVLNSLKNKGAGFHTDTNKITIIGKDNKIKEFELKSKHEVAQDIINYLAHIL